MATLRAFGTGHPALTYFALTFSISWGGILLVVGGPGGLPGTPEQIARLLPPVMLALFAGPSVAGVLTTGLVHGRAGLRDLLARMTRWRVGARWYAVALLTGPLLFTAVSLALSLTSAEFLPGILATSDKASLLLFGISYGLIGGGLLEELGWTGCVVPTLRSRYSALRTGLVVGLAWGAWHFVVIYWMSDPSGEVPLAVLLPIQLFSWLPAFRVLMVWVYDRTGGSLLIAMLMHASLSAGMLILQPLAMEGTVLLTYVLAFAAALWVVVGVVRRAYAL